MHVWVKYLNFRYNLHIYTAVYQMAKGQLLYTIAIRIVNASVFSPLFVKTCIAIDPDTGLQTIKIM